MTETTVQHKAHPAIQEEWMEAARVFRAALTGVLGDHPGECLPGEKDACGHSAVEHVLGYAALLGAHGLHLAEYLTPEKVSYFWDIFDAQRAALIHEHEEGNAPHAA